MNNLTQIRLERGLYGPVVFGKRSCQGLPAWNSGGVFAKRSQFGEVDGGAVPGGFWGSRDRQIKAGQGQSSLDKGENFFAREAFGHRFVSQTWQ